MRVAFASSDWSRSGTPGGSGWMRAHLPAEGLAARGHDTVVGNGVVALPDGKLVAAWGKTPLLPVPDVLVAQRWMHRDAQHGTRRARAAGQVVVQDVDDWFWGLDPANQAHATTAAAADRHANRTLYRANVVAATAATVSSAFLERRVRERFGVRTILLRNAVDAPAFTRQPVRDVDRGLVVGWMGALGWRSGDLEVLRGVLDPWLESTGSTFVHHGTFPGDTDTAADRLGVAPERAGPTRPAVVPDELPDLLEGFDVGLVPLADVPFNHAKSWIKGLEYAAAGIPFVAQHTHEYEQLGAGLLARTPAEWRVCLDLLTDPEVRADERRRGFAAAARNDVRVRAEEYERVLSELLERR